MRWLALAGVLLALPAWAGPVDCSQTVGTVSTVVPFPASGSGPSKPTQYITICDAHGSNTLGVNILGGAAALGSQGTIPLASGQCLPIARAALPLPGIQVIGSGAGTTTACMYQ